MRTALTFVLLALLLVSLPASAKRDPLTADEVQQLRDAAQEPDKRLALYVKFIRARATTLEQTYSDPRLAAGRGQHENQDCSSVSHCYFFCGSMAFSRCRACHS